MNPRVKPIVDALLPLLTGVVVGLLSALATFSGRIAALETTAIAHSEQLRDIKTDLRAISSRLARNFDP